MPRTPRYGRAVAPHQTCPRVNKTPAGYGCTLRGCERNFIDCKLQRKPSWIRFRRQHYFCNHLWIPFLVTCNHAFQPWLCLIASRWQEAHDKEAYRQAVTWSQRYFSVVFNKLFKESNLRMLQRNNCVQRWCCCKASRSSHRCYWWCICCSGSVDISLVVVWFSAVLCTPPTQKHANTGLQAWYQKNIT